jgi:hypothetical protein
MTYMHVLNRGTLTVRSPAAYFKPALYHAPPRDITRAPQRIQPAVASAVPRIFIRPDKRIECVPPDYAEPGKYEFSYLSRAYMKRLRLITFGCLGIAAILLANTIKRAGGVEVGDHSALLLLSVVGGVFCVTVFVDTVWHAIKGQGQACRHCGHLRQMSSFRVYAKCPSCGE